MTVQDVKDRIQKLHKAKFTYKGKVRWDHEGAHCIEDDLYEELLRAIADNNCEDSQQCAKLALSTKDIDFARWCA